MAISTEPQRQSEYLQIYLKFQHLTKRKKEKNNAKKWKEFSVSFSKFELDDVSELKIIGKLVLKFLMSLRVSHKYGV